MMTDMGHDVFLYAGTENESRIKELITIVTDSDRKKWFGTYNWDRDVFNGWNADAEWWVTMNGRATEEIRKRAVSGDFLGIIGGLCQESISKSIPELQTVEWGIGYEGILDKFHVFESYAWMHYIYGKYEIVDGRFFDTVIPNAFEPEEFNFSDRKDDYLLFLGRHTPRKGLHVVEMLAKRGLKIKTAGQGDLRIPGAEYVGVVRGNEKKELLARAKAVLVPTFYIEPFGGVAVEAMLSGTPVVTTDFGAFTETVKPGVNGFRAHTIGEFISAVDSCESLSPHIIRKSAEKYLTTSVRCEYHQYFQRLKLLEKDGWYSV